MPTGTLSGEGKKLFEKVYQERLKACKDKGGAEDKCQQAAAKQAWSVVEANGWSKDKDGNWHKSADLHTFSLAITKASYDKTTQEMRWQATASDTQTDLYDDNMSLELFEDFLERIESNEPAPEDFRSTFWGGGMPYLSISHYPDLEGAAVPGTIEAVYIDGDQLKSKGTFSDTPQGRACFKSVLSDLYGDNKTGENKVRISIAFIDWKHRHKDSNYTFERASLDDACPECMKNMILGIMDGKLPHPTLQGPKEYLRGQLIHEAMTRVPVNTRTLMEVERSMTTRKEDAASIVGEELADEIEKQAALVGKSEALVIKADAMLDCAENESEEDCKKRMAEAEAINTETKVLSEAVHEKSMDKEMDCDDDDPDCKKKMADKKKKMAEKSDVSSKSYIGEVSVISEPEEWHPFGGATSMGEAMSVIEAQKEQWRIQDLWWMFQSVINNIMSAEESAVPDKGKAISAAANEFKTLLGKETSKAMFNLLTTLSTASEVKPVSEPHPLDAVFGELRSQFDVQIASGAAEEDVLRALQAPYAAIGDVIKASVHPKVETPADPNQDALNSVLQSVQQLSQQVGLLSARLDGINKPPAEVQVPARRQVNPAMVPQITLQRAQMEQVQSATPKLRALINRTTN